MQMNKLPGFKLAFIASVFAIFVIGLGAFTRLVDAGLGCPDWPTCYGHVLWPETAQEITAANQAFPDTPVETDKTWPEMVHRYLAKGLGLLAIAIYVIAFRHRNADEPVKLISSLLFLNVALTVVTVFVGEAAEIYAAGSIIVTFLVLIYYGLMHKSSGAKQPFKLPAFILAFVILQGLFGMWTVTWKLWPQVVTAHLLGGFTIFSLLWLLVLRLSHRGWRVSQYAAQQLTAFRPWVVLGLVIVVLQIALGGWTTSNYAAVACPDLPTCQNQWLPAMNFAEGFNFAQSIGPNYLGGFMNNEARVAIHFMHRVGAIMTTLYLLMLCFVLYRSIAITQTKLMAKAVLGVLGLQVLLGLANIVFHFPVFIAVAHNLGGAFLLVTMVTLNYRVFTVKADQSI